MLFVVVVPLAASRLLQPTLACRSFVCVRFARRPGLPPRPRRLPASSGRLRVGGNTGPEAEAPRNLPVVAGEVPRVLPGGARSRWVCVLRLHCETDSQAFAAVNYPPPNVYTPPFVVGGRVIPCLWYVFAAAWPPDIGWTEYQSRFVAHDEASRYLRALTTPAAVPLPRPWLPPVASSLPLYRCHRPGWLVGWLVLRFLLLREPERLLLSSAK